MNDSARPTTHSAAISDARIEAAMDAFYPGEDWRVALGIALPDSLRDMRAAIAAADAAAHGGEGAGLPDGLEGRQPISEAPRDGTRLLCLTILGSKASRHPEWNIGHFDADLGGWYSEEGSDIDPSYFYPLPDWRSGRAALAERGGAE